MVLFIAVEIWPNLAILFRITLNTAPKMCGEVRQFLFVGTRLLHVADVCLPGLDTWLSREPAGCRLTSLWVDDEGEIGKRSPTGMFIIL